MGSLPKSVLAKRQFSTRSCPSFLRIEAQRRRRGFLSFRAARPGSCCMVVIEIWIGKVYFEPSKVMYPMRQIGTRTPQKWVVFPPLNIVRLQTRHPPLLPGASRGGGAAAAAGQSAVAAEPRLAAGRLAAPRPCALGRGARRAARRQVWPRPPPQAPSPRLPVLSPSVLPVGS